MTKAQTIQLRLSECRQKLNDLLQVETRSAEQQTEMETLTKEVSAKEPELRAAFAAEPDPETVVTPTVDAETREKLELRGKAHGEGLLTLQLSGTPPRWCSCRVPRGARLRRPDDSVRLLDEVASGNTRADSGTGDRQRRQPRSHPAARVRRRLGRAARYHHEDG